MRKFLSVLVVAATSAFIAAPASASLIGSTVTGSASFNGSTINLFDPANGVVPATGYTNSSSKSNSATVSITGNDVEFGLADALNTDTADFNGGTLNITDIAHTGYANYSYKYVFTDSAFSGLTLKETSDNFLNGGASANLVDTTLTILVPAFTGAGTYSAQYTFDKANNPGSSSTGSNVPEPASIALLGLGLLGVAASRRKSSKQ